MGFGRKQKDRQKHKKFTSPRQVGPSPAILGKGHRHNDLLEEFESEDDAIAAGYEEFLYIQDEHNESD